MIANRASGKQGQEKKMTTIPKTLEGCANFSNRFGRAIDVPNHLIPQSVLDEAGVITREQAAERGIEYQGRDDGGTAEDLCGYPIERWGKGPCGWMKKGEIYNAFQLYSHHGERGAVFVRPDDWGHRA